MPPVDLRPGQFVEGSLFSVKFVPGNKEATFYVVGKDALKIKVDRLKLELITEDPGGKQSFILRRKNKVFLFSEKTLSDFQLKIHAEDGRVDQLRMKSSP